jgi:hypothetical protein
MTHWTEAAEMLDERDAAPPSAVVRYAPGAFAFVMSAALGVYLVYLRPHLFAPAPELAAPPSVAAPFNPDAFGGLAPVNPPPSMALAAPSAGNPYGRIVTDGFETPAQFSLAEQDSAPVPPVVPPDLRRLSRRAGGQVGAPRPGSAARHAAGGRLDGPRHGAEPVRKTVRRRDYGRSDGRQTAGHPARLRRPAARIRDLLARRHRHGSRRPAHSGRVWRLPARPLIRRRAERALRRSRRRL